MNLPLDQFEDNIARVNDLRLLHAVLTKQTTAAIDLSDLLRASYVIVVSAIDHYVHEVTRAGMMEIFDGVRPATQAYNSHRLTMQSLAGALTVADARSNIEADIRNQHSYQAFQKPEKASHNIYELVKHMYCWRKFVLEHLKGNTSYSVELNSEADWITHYERKEVSWNAALEELENNQNELVKAFENFPEEKLEELVPGKKFNWYVMIHGCIHHDIYHSAQISILKK